MERGTLYYIGKEVGKYGDFRTGEDREEEAQIIRCPWCGGTTGFGYVVITRYFVTFTWEGENDGGATELGGNSSDDRKLIVCQDCHKQMRRSTLERLQREAGMEA